jgi:hypothetical protein
VGLYYGKSVFLYLEYISGLGTLEVLNRGGKTVLKQNRGGDLKGSNGTFLHDSLPIFGIHSGFDLTWNSLRLVGGTIAACHFCQAVGCVQKWGRAGSFKRAHRRWNVQDV